VPISEAEDAEVYLVVINAEEQYSIWPSRKDVPRGWKLAGKQGSKAECLKYIDEVWTDMRPGSLRRGVEKSEKR
jgi:MbtH protein